MRNLSRTWFTAVLLAAAIASMQVLSACGNNSGGNSPAPAPVVPPVGSPISACQVGQIYNPTYGCLAQYTCSQGYGWAPSINQCVQGQVVTMNDITGGNVGAMTQFSGTLSVNNQSTFFQFLKYMGVCDFAWAGPLPTQTGGANFGTAACSNYSSAAYIDILASVTPTITTATIKITASGSGWWSFGTTAYIYTTQSGQITPYNNSTGMQIVGSAYNGQQTGLRLIVNSGNFNSPNFGLTARYGNVDFATANVQRYY